MLGILAVIAVIAGSGILYLRHVRRIEAFAATGSSCTGGYDCQGGVCIREDEDHLERPGYCGNLRDDDKGCPSGYICQPTRSQRRRACMIGARDP